MKTSMPHWTPLLVLRVVVVVVLMLDAAAVIGGLASHSDVLVRLDSGKYVLSPLGLLHVVFWTIGPPAWFFIETYWVRPDLLPTADHGTDPDLKARYDRLRLAQELASKVWAAVVAAILFLVPKA